MIKEELDSLCKIVAEHYLDNFIKNKSSDFYYYNTADLNIFNIQDIDLMNEYVINHIVHRYLYEAMINKSNIDIRHGYLDYCFTIERLYETECFKVECGNSEFYIFKIDKSKLN